MSNNIAVKTLAKFIKDNLEIKVYENWPDSKDKMALPSVSLLANNRRLENYPPELLSSYNHEDNPDLINSVYLTGHYDYSIQMDLWTDYKQERSKLVERIDALFMSQFVDKEEAGGLSLKLIDYADTIARYDIVGYDYFDSDNSSSTSEFRVKIEVLVSHPKILIKSEPRMKNIILEHYPTEYNEFNESDLDLKEI